MSEKKTTVCIVGTGMIAGVHAAGYNRCPGVDLKIFNRTRSKAEKFAQQFEVSEI
ncbi:MAG TPA: gfo/Idh/MocA family oxidoreductase, partial [Phycisphaerae bacterium]|nr:gfo/Idh/MocA family oxidoreductase [Phycisphaerae bacterium]